MTTIFSPAKPRRGLRRGLLYALALLPAAHRACAQATPAQSAASVAPALTGQVQDATGAIIPGARIELQQTSGKLISTTQTDSAGRFSLAVPSTGDFRITVALPGFEPLVKPIRAGRGPLVLTLAPAAVSTSVDVNANQVDLASTENNQDAASLSSDDMKTLPILDGDVVSTLSAFLDAGATGEGGATLIVDGVEMKTLGVAPSAIERVSINQDPYSAQYRQPGRGQVEIITKNTADKFHGSGTFTFRDSAMNASNYFAKTKPPESRKNFEGFLTGPIRPLRETTFLFSVLRQQQNYFNQVIATTAPGVTTTDNVAAPFRNTQLTMKVAHQVNDHHSIYGLYRLFHGSRVNSNVGGLTLASAGYTSYTYDMDLTFHDDLILSPTKINQFNILFERNADRIASAVQAPSIIVQGAFNGGGAQADTLQTENNPNISDIVFWSVGGAAKNKHQLKFGVQLPNLGRRVIEDETNRQGTYTFANLAAYQAGTPQTFSIQQGQSKFLTHFDQPGAFFLDQIQVTDKLTVTPGVRYDFQNALPGTMDAVLPRLAIAYLLDKPHAMVLRVGAGEYMRRVGVNVGQQLARYQYAAEQNFLLTSNICYNPVTPCSVITAQPPSLFNFEPHIKAPFQGYFGMSLERELTAKSTLTIGYEGYRGWHALRSVDINAPLPPFTSTARPNPNYAQILQLQSGGIQRSDAMIVSFRGRLTNTFTGFAQYTFQHAAPTPSGAPSTRRTSTPPTTNTAAPTRISATASVSSAPSSRISRVNLGLGFYDNSPQPYTITTGTDDYHTGFFNARPAGIPRNSLNGGSYQDLQVRLNYTYKLRPKLKDASPAISASLSSFNTLNRANFEDYVGVVTSPNFMKPTSAGGARRLQIVVGYTF